MNSFSQHSTSSGQDIEVALPLLSHEQQQQHL
jgi:hypothetical protein